MARADEYEDVYDDDELGEGVEGEDLDLPSEEDQRNRKIMVLTSSYGLSALIHVGLIIMFMFIMWSKPQDLGKKAVVLPKLEQKVQEYDPTKKRALHKKPEIQHEQVIEKPIKELEEEVEKTNDIPKGTSMDNQANKNLDSTSVVDAYAVGGGAAGAYGQRFGKGSLTNVGGTPATESAVLAALWWLQRHQDADGKWSCAEFHKNCRQPACSGPDFRTASGMGSGTGDNHFDVGVTSLALLAFLGNGHTHRFSPYPEFKTAVKHGIAKLVKIQQADGSIGYTPGEDGEQTIYNHAIATMALCEAYLLGRKDFTLKKPAQKAVDWMIRAQNPSLGWKYEPVQGKNDTSVTGWVVLALKSAKVADLTVPQNVFDGALAWFERATSDGGPGKPPGLVGYERPGDGGSTINRKLLAKHLNHPLEHYPKFEGAPTMTAVAVLCRIFTGQKRTVERIKQGVKVLMAKLPRWETKKTKNETNFYYWYYGTYGVFQSTPLNSREWKRWNKAMQEALLGDGSNRQRMGNVCEDGSWDPIGEWGVSGGRVYATAINALTLEIYYRYEHALEGQGM